MRKVDAPAQMVQTEPRHLAQRRVLCWRVSNTGWRYGRASQRSRRPPRQRNFATCRKTGTVACTEDSASSQPTVFAWLSLHCPGILQNAPTQTAKLLEAQTTLITAPPKNSHTSESKESIGSQHRCTAHLGPALVAMTQAVDGDPGSDTNSVQRLRGHDRAPAQNTNCTKHEDYIYNAQEIGVKKQRTPPRNISLK